MRLVFCIGILCGGLLRGWPADGESKTATTEEVTGAMSQNDEPRRVFYVRQTIGDDKNDGLSPKTAWQSIAKLGPAMQAGDVAYVGPGLYRETVILENDGTAARWITIIADSSGQHTGDPAGTVMLSGSIPFDGNKFEVTDYPGVYKLPWSGFAAWGGVEMEGPQYRYMRVRDTMEYAADKMTELEALANRPSTWYLDPNTKVLYVSTTDGKHPKTHEMELIQHLNGFYLNGKDYIRIIGFTMRHFGDAGINFYKGCNHGMAVNNTVYGSRIGVRARASTNIIAEANIFFRNENSGVYFLANSQNGVAFANVCYENLKGVRWSSGSGNGIGIGNLTFDNHERGISVENSNGIILRGNRMINNTISQLLIIRSECSSDVNCFQNGAETQSIADFHYGVANRYRTLAEYRTAKTMDIQSREGRCGEIPEKIDVHKLHSETMSYTAQARQNLRNVNYRAR
jgi:parallel beta-helix repeat protein